MIRHDTYGSSDFPIAGKELDNLRPRSRDRGKTYTQPQSERDKYLAVRSRRRQWGQPKSRDPAGGERPVELIRCQPFDERPQRFGVSGTNGISLHRRYISPEKTGRS